LAFIDNGAGIEDSDIAESLLLFLTTKNKGHGLGLTVCKQVLVLRNGLIDIKVKRQGYKSIRNLPVKKKYVWR